MLSSNVLVTAHAHRLVQTLVSMGTEASNCHCSDGMTLPINDWHFRLEGGTISPYYAWLFLPFRSIGVNCLCISIVFYSLPYLQLIIINTALTEGAFDFV